MLKRRSRVDRDYFKFISDNKMKCKCGHTYVLLNVDKEVCRWCGRWIYKDKRTEFKNKLKGELEKNAKR